MAHSLTLAREDRDQHILDNMKGCYEASRTSLSSRMDSPRPNNGVTPLQTTPDLTLGMVSPAVGGSRLIWRLSN